MTGNTRYAGSAEVHLSEPFTSEQLAGLALACGVQAQPTELRLSRVRTGKHNLSYWVDGGPHRSVLRIAPPDSTGLLFYERRMMRQEPDLHALIRARTSVPVAEVVGFDFSHARIARDYLVMAALPGTALSEAHWIGQHQRERALRQVGAMLRQVHALTAQDCLGSAMHGYLGAHHPMEPQPTWASAFRVMWNRLLDDVVASGAYTASEAQALRELLDRYRELFERPVVPRLLHMDIWSQNILVDGAGNVTGLVDFDRALWGDVEIEFAVLDYCGISEPAFWEGYGEARDESPDAQTRQRFYLLYEVQKYMPIAIWRGDGLRAALRTKRDCFALAAPLFNR